MCTRPTPAYGLQRHRTAQIGLDYTRMLLAVWPHRHQFAQDARQNRAHPQLRFPYVSWNLAATADYPLLRHASAGALSGCWPTAALGNLSRIDRPTT
jgi:hypothetical protein